MAKRRPASPPDKPAPRRLSRHHLALALLVLAATALFWLGGSSFSQWATLRATGQLRKGAISEALRHLQQAEEWDPHNGRADLLQAFCYRQLHQLPQWQSAIDAALAKGVARSDVQHERELYRIQTGDLPPGAEAELPTLADGAITTYDVPAAFVAGYLASNQLALAKRMLEAWSANTADSAHVAFATGQYWLQAGDRQLAQEEFARAIALEPHHELARAALGNCWRTTTGSAPPWTSFWPWDGFPPPVKRRCWGPPASCEMSYPRKRNRSWLLLSVKKRLGENGRRHWRPNWDALPWIKANLRQPRRHFRTRM